MRYAQWELEQKEFRRARSVFERALDVDSTAVVLWIRYIEAEMKTRNINHARNLLDRAVTILPRIDKLWYKYVRYWSKSTCLRGYVLIRIIGLHGRNVGPNR
jgi:crooked neck